MHGEADEGFGLYNYTEYEMVTKDAEGEAHVHKLRANRFAREPQEIDEASFITTAAPTIIRPSKRAKPVRTDSVSVILPDMQIGFRGEEAFHDERAMLLGLTAISELRPDNVILLGDNLDLPTFSKFDRDGLGWSGRVQPAIDRLHRYLAEIRATMPETNLVMHFGNHDIRLQKQIIKHNAELLGLRRANAAEELGVLSLQFLLRTEQLSVKTIDSYPRGNYWLEDNLRTMHGVTVRSGGSTAQAVVNQSETSTIFGHVHRIEVASKTTDSGKVIQAVTPGTFAKISGEVPSQAHSVDESDRTVHGHDNWQQGFAVVHHNERVHQIDVIRINEGSMNLYGKTYAQPS
jgi:hypothetical protein